MAEPLRLHEPSRQPDEDGRSLPGWIYRDADFLEAEREAVFAARSCS